jgi:hypothetical protein
MISVDDTVIKALVTLKASDAPILAIVNRQGEVGGVFVGYNLIGLLHRVALTSPEKVWASLYRTTVYDVGWFTLPAETFMSLKDLVASMRARGWGFARVRLGEAQHLVTILDVAMFLASSGTLERTSLRLLDIASENVVSVGRDSTVFELMSVMLSRRVRRVVLEGEDYVITDRSILQYLVSNPVLEMLRDNPSKVMDTTIDALLGYAGNPVILSRDTALSVAVRKLVEREPHTVLTEDKRCILTPWDITKLLKK